MTDDGSLAHAENQVKIWDEHISKMMLSHDLYMVAGSYNEDEANLHYWKSLVRQRKQKE